MHKEKIPDMYIVIPRYRILALKLVLQLGD